MTRVLHTGDTHLGYQQYHLPERREDFQRAFEQVAADAVDEGVDAVVHAGDLFHDRKPRLSDIMGALSVLRDLDGAGIPFLAVVGNHEGKRSQQWLDLFESMGLATRLGSEPVRVGDAAFYGLDFVPRSKRDELDYEFAPHDAEYAALVSHGLFEPFEHGEWDAAEISREATVEFDAMLVGDDHEAKTKQLPDDTWITYCGSTERASASEREDRGYNLVSFEETVDIRRRGLDTREFVFLDIELRPGEGSERVRERIDQHEVEDAVVIVRLTGEGEQVMPAGIEEYADDQGALATRVNDQRELDEETDVEVSFADPDEAVQRRISELGLSPAARDLDETIRASKVADSNVADEVQRRVEEFVAEADAEAFTSADEGAKADADDQNGTATAEMDERAADGGGDSESDGQVTMEDYL
ncbi:exonuclease SbcCD subunit D [Halovenus sp. WSH3]|uniref:DNA double-strand break repair protein Mre11 n=1 Tax=Halovenus carboxidivorans TaxID=2692199 RepID=A0A6B0T198_9EURY|nr:DNA double-strand break repair protein Mre11 [Halovenus carboxidivorans]MXR51705.1 exonuclease SbcCD subunit D [Halovenus carboxidivorans]